MAGIALTQITGDLWWDGLASVVIGLILGATAFWLAVETKGLLIGEGADEETVESIRALAEAQDGIESINEILTLHMGPEFILANISIEFKDDQKTQSIEKTIHDLDKAIKSKHPYIKRIFIEAETGDDPA